MSYHLKAIAPDFGINLVCKDDYWLSRIVGFGGSMPIGCGVKRKLQVGDCVKGVVYEISVACGFRCFKEEMMEHILNVRIKTSQSQLVRHLN